MGYPYDKRYIDKIRESDRECKAIREVFYAFRLKRAREKRCDVIELSLPEQFKLLGEAFENASDTVGDISDQYHFVGDIIEELLTSDKEKAEMEERYKSFVASSKNDSDVSETS